jgi:hypothetical protein
MKFRRLFGLTVVVIITLTVIVWFITIFVQKTIPFEINNAFYFWFVALLAVMAFLSYLNDGLTLIERIISSIKKRKPEENPGKETMPVSSVKEKEKGDQPSLLPDNEKKHIKNVQNNNGVDGPEIGDSKTDNFCSLLATFTGLRYQPICLAFSKDGQLLLCGGADKIVYVWDTKSIKEVARLGRTPDNHNPENGGIYSLAISQDNQKIVSGDCSLFKTQKIRFWNSYQISAEIKLSKTGYITNLTFSPDDQRIAATIDDKGLVVYDANGLGEICRIDSHIGQSTLSIGWGISAWIKDEYKDNQIVEVWDYEKKQKLTEIGIHATTQYSSIAISPDKSAIALASGFRANIYEIESKEELYSFITLNSGMTRNIRKITYSPDGKKIAIGCKDGEVFFYDLEFGAKLNQIQCEGRIDCMSFSPDGKLLAIGVDGPRGNGAFPSGVVELWSINE